MIGSILSLGFLALTSFIISVGGSSISSVAAQGNATSADLAANVSATIPGVLLQKAVDALRSDNATESVEVLSEVYQEASRNCSWCPKDGFPPIKDIGEG